MSDVLRIKIQGELPPKKDGANSMWRKPVEVRRLLVLRRAVANALDAERPPQEPLELRLRVWADRSAGDLDNFVTGICDGLMAAHRSVVVRAADWDGVPAAALPDQALVVSDDSLIDRVVAERLPPRAGGPAYELEIQSSDQLSQPAP